MNTQRSRYKELTPEEATYCKRQMLKTPSGFTGLTNHIVTDGHLSVKVPKYMWYVIPWKTKI